MIKYLNCLFILLCLVSACKNNPAPNNTSAADSAKIVTLPKQDTITTRLWIVRDSSFYTKTFLQELYNNPDSISLADNYIVYKHDTIYFPDYFAGNRQTLFGAQKDSIDYKLQVFNCTYNKIQFIFTAAKNKSVQRFYGESELQPNFFITHDTDVNDADSVKYKVSRYKGENEKYQFEIYIGTAGDKLLARFFAHAKDSTANKNFTTCPSLVSAVKYVPTRKHN